MSVMNEKTTGFLGNPHKLIELLLQLVREKVTNNEIDEISAEEIRRIWDGVSDDIEFAVAADFVSEGGFGSLRYYQNKLSYYSKTTNQWIDMTVTSDNTSISLLGLTPNSMQSFAGIFDCNKMHYKLKWLEPKDTVLDGQAVCMVERVVIRRKINANPTSITDGDLVMEIPRSMFGMHHKRWWVDESFTPSLGDVYYYKAFPVSTFKQVNTMSDNDTGAMLAKDYELYGMTIQPNTESDCGSIIGYIEDNKNFTPVHMNYLMDEFDYGDFTPADVFFMNVFPCMLNNDGTVHKKLNPNDYTLYEDGTPSDITNPNFNGDAMIGRPKMYTKFSVNENGEYEVRFCSKKLDDDYQCWKWMDINGDEIPYVYDAIYNGYVLNGKTRSLSGYQPTVRTTRNQEVEYATAKNTAGNQIWYTKTFSDWITDVLLLWLIGKSTNTYEVFGHGNNSSYVNDTNTGVIKSGTMDKKGLFYGRTDNVSGVKVFGMENIWGNIWNNCAGLILDNGKFKFKLTQSKKDGTTVNNYNFDGAGYIEVPNVTPSGTNGGHCSKILFDEKFGILPIIASGSATTYYQAGFWFNNTDVRYAIVGGNASFALRVGAFACSLNDLVSMSNWVVGSLANCKPLAS